MKQVHRNHVIKMEARLTPRRMLAVRRGVVRTFAPAPQDSSLSSWRAHVSKHCPWKKTCGHSSRGLLGEPHWDSYLLPCFPVKIISYRKDAKNMRLFLHGLGAVSLQQSWGASAAGGAASPSPALGRDTGLLARCSRRSPFQRAQQSPSRAAGLLLVPATWLSPELFLSCLKGC